MEELDNLNDFDSKMLLSPKEMDHVASIIAAICFDLADKHPQHIVVTTTSTTTRRRKRGHSVVSEEEAQKSKRRHHQQQQQHDHQQPSVMREPLQVLSSGKASRKQSPPPPPPPPPQPPSPSTVASADLEPHDLLRRARSRLYEEYLRHETQVLPHVLFGDRYNTEGRIGVYSPRERLAILQKFKEKKSRRIWDKTIRYNVRKNFADQRMRVKGRFVKHSASNNSTNPPNGNTTETNTNAAVETEPPVDQQTGEQQPTTSSSEAVVDNAVYQNAEATTQATTAGASTVEMEVVTAIGEQAVVAAVTSLPSVVTEENQTPAQAIPNNSESAAQLGLVSQPPVLPSEWVTSPPMTQTATMNQPSTTNSEPMDTATSEPTAATVGVVVNDSIPVTTRGEEANDDEKQTLPPATVTVNGMPPSSTNTGTASSAVRDDAAQELLMLAQGVFPTNTDAQTT